MGEVGAGNTGQDGPRGGSQDPGPLHRAGPEHAGGFAPALRLPHRRPRFPLRTPRECRRQAGTGLNGTCARARLPPSPSRMSHRVAPCVPILSLLSPRTGKGQGVAPLPFVAVSPNPRALTRNRKRPWGHPGDSARPASRPVRGAERGLLSPRERRGPGWGSRACPCACPCACAPPATRAPRAPRAPVRLGSRFPGGPAQRGGQTQSPAIQPGPAAELGRPTYRTRWAVTALPVCGRSAARNRSRMPPPGHRPPRRHRARGRGRGRGRDADPGGGRLRSVSPARPPSPPRRFRSPGPGRAWPAGGACRGAEGLGRGAWTGGSTGASRGKQKGP